METLELREDIPRLEDAFCCRVTCTTCMERELRRMESTVDCCDVCAACMEKILRTL
ncbi:MAG: hypothetical protein HXS46_05180 [Theionarchaea archaeon]|nr:hypothetical protein [Theionarchaea archaeon]